VACGGLSPESFPPSMWAIGDECEAKDKKGTWYEAKIKRVKGDGDERKHFVKFSGWGERYNEWLLAEKIRPRDPEWLYQDEATVDSFEKGEEGLRKGTSRRTPGRSRRSLR
jgi:hypothetical protein